MPTISLTVNSMDNYVYPVAKTMAFSIEGITKLQNNLNPSTNAYALSLAGESQFVYVEGQITGTTAAHKYTVDETVTEIMALIDAWKP